MPYVDVGAKLLLPCESTKCVGVNLAHHVWNPPPAPSPLQVRDIQLVGGGESKRVTDRNKKDFVKLATRRRLLGGADAAIFAMRSGIADVIPKNLLTVLLPSEVRD